MFIKSVSVRGFRAAAVEDFTCELPGRFALLVGGNNAGKTTVCESIYLAHRHRFPQLQRPTAELLRRARHGDRELVIEYAFEQEPAFEGALGRHLLLEAQPAPVLSKPLTRALGRLRVGTGDEPEPDGLRVIYLPAHRNPVDELARRDADILVELLRAEQQRRAGHRSLHELRRRAEDLLEELAQHDLVLSLEQRVQGVMKQLSAGVSSQVPFFGAQHIDDRFLARVLELLLATGLERTDGQRLELSGLGYVNLLHIAVTLAAIPDLSEPAEVVDEDGEQAEDSTDAGGASAGPEVADTAENGPSPDEVRSELDEAGDRSEADEDSFFAGVFHVSVVIEEPEAHLHPQLQHGLIRYLRRTTEQRPDLQVIVSSHAPDLISAVAPRDIVVLRRSGSGRRSMPLAQLPGTDTVVEHTLRLAALHLDASRSAALLAERLLIVEGLTDALIVRKLGRHWAGSDIARVNFIDALTIVPIGSKVGEWPVRLLATPGFEIATRLGVLTDSDQRTEVPTTPAWVDTYGAETFRYRQSHPTLEPSLALPANEAVLANALSEVGVDLPDPYTQDAVDDLFRGEHKDGDVSVPAGAASKKKGEFAYALAAHLDDAPVGSVEVPDHLSELLDFLFEGLDPGVGGTEAPQADTEPDTNAEPASASGDETSATDDETEAHE